MLTIRKLFLKCLFLSVLITGADVRMQIVDWNGRTSLNLRLGQCLLLDGASGTLSIRVPAATMQGLVAGSYTYDIQIRRAGAVDVPVAGTLTVQQGVTRV
jgi:hypothetical protein